MAGRTKARGGEKQQQSLSLGRETVEELEKEAERRGLNKSQLADLLLNGQLTQSADDRFFAHFAKRFLPCLAIRRF